MLLSRGVAIRKLYFADHVKVRESAVKIRKSLQEYFHGTGETELFIGIVDGTFVYRGRALTGPSVVGHQLIELADALSCGGFTFRSSVSSREIRDFLDLSADLRQSVDGLGEARELLLSRGIGSIELAYHYVESSKLVGKQSKFAWMGKDSGYFLHSPTLLYQALYDVVASAHDNASLHRKIDIESAKSVSEHLLRHTRANFSDIMQQVRYPDFDTYTVGHSVRVATLAVFIGTTLGLQEKALLDIGTAALLHDVGKSRIGEEILFKPGRLTEEEMAEMKKHASFGAEILLEQGNATDLDIAAAWGHHIRFDGSGYPESPGWLVTHPITALLRICDVFEALTAIRPYKHPLSPQQAYSIMLADKGSFHLGLLAHFMAVIGLYPPGNLVTLSDGRKAIVIATGRQLDRPLVEIQSGSSPGDDAGSLEGLRLDLAGPEHRGLSITGLELNR